MYAFVHIILLILFLAGIGEAKTCMEDVVKSGMRTWLAVMLPVFVLSIVSLLGICGLLVTTKVTGDKQAGFCYKKTVTNIFKTTFSVTFAKSEVSVHKEQR